MALPNKLTTAWMLGFLIGCGTSSATGSGGVEDPMGTDTGSTGGSDGTGSTGGSDTSGGGMTTGSTTPVFPTAHPRIYLTSNRARLAAALSAGTPAATRFKTIVDQWMGGADLWGFSAWNAALIGQLTGNANYCTKAVATIESQVTAAEGKIAAGQAPEVAGDSYLGVGDMIGDLAL